MTAQLSREELRTLALKKVESLKFAITQSAFTNIRRELEGELQLAEFALAGMDSEPVIIVGNDGGDSLAYRRLIQSFAPGTKLYTAPPAPVAVPDEWRSILQEMVNAMLAYEMDVGEPAPYKHRKMMMRAGHLLASHRAAMQAEPVTSVTVPEEKGSSLQLRNLIRQRHAEWSEKTFGNVGPVGPLKHLAKEAIEAADAPDDLSEWADMQFLLWDAQRRAGICDGEITAAMEEKLKVNMSRQWPEPKDGEPRLHIKHEQEV